MNFSVNKKITSPPFDHYAQQVNTEAIKIMFANLPSIAISAALMVLVMVWVLWDSADRATLLIWAAFVLAITFSELVIGKSFSRHMKLGTKAVRWGRLYTYSSMLNGFSWGSACVLFFVSDSAVLQVFLLTCMVGIATASIIQHSYWLESYYAFTIPLLLLSGLRLYWEGGTAYQGLAALTLVLLVIVIQMAHESQKSVLAAIRLRFENLVLIERLNEEKEKAEQANTAKSKFLAAASHDLRQPIHAQGLFLEVLSRTELTPQQRELLTNARSASEASSEMLNTLLDFSRIEAGVVVPQIQSFALQPLLHKIENDLAPQADTKNIVYRSRDTHLVVQSDPVLVELILRNLISNAIRYTNKGGVLVGCRQHCNQVSVEIWDTGLGIEPSQQQEVFREFHQLGNPERDSKKGLGLGLAIADGLARTLGHSLSLVSNPHRGSVFRLALPIANIAMPVELTVTANVSKQPLYVRVLVIDDDAAVRAGMLHLLSDWGCDCEAAESIEEALILARANVPDIIISDYRLREHRTGVEAIMALRALLGNTLPAILVTGDTAPERLHEAQLSGFPLMHKPVSTSQLYFKLLELQQETIKTIKHHN